jgi:RNase P subunit RPR2
MIAITCDKCRRRFTPTSDEIQVYLAESQGQKHTPVPCPHCGKANKVSSERLHEAVRFATPAPPPAEDPAA